jgi:hypothetical protein
VSRVLQVAGIVAIVAAVALAALVTVRVAQRGRHVTELSTFGAGPKGAKALYLLAETLGGEPIRWVEDFSRPPEGGMLVVLGQCGGGRRPSPVERDALARWVEQGGVLVVAGARHVATAGAGLGAHLEGGCPEPAWVEALLSDPADDDEALEGEGEEALSYAGLEEPLHFARPVADPLHGIGLVAMEAPARIVVHDEVQARVLLEGIPDDAVAEGEAWSSTEGPPMAVALERGRGTVVLIASASPFHNRSLGWASGGLLFARLHGAHALGGSVLFDEYHLGVGEPRSLARYIRQLGGGPVVLQLLFVTLLFLWGRGARLGTPRVDPPPPPAGTSSYVEAVAHLYRRSGDAVGAWRVLIKRGLGRIAQHHHVRATDPEGLAKALDARARAGEARAVRRVGELEATVDSDRSLTAAVQALDGQILRATAPEREDSP